MNEFYSDYDSLLDCFSTMTVDGGASDTQAFAYLREKTTPDLIQKLQSRIASNANLRGLPNEAADIPQLEKYLAASYFFYPCEHNGKTKPICAIYDNDNQLITENRIDTIEKLHQFINGAGVLQTKDGKQWHNTKPINIFAIYPKQNQLFCIDIDRAEKADGNTHGAGTDGVAEFKRIVASLDLTDRDKAMFENFPRNFPCYVTTPSAGIHLYFKYYGKPDNWQLADAITDLGKKTNIECKYNKQITIAGSVKNGRRYTMHGSLTAAPIIPITLLNEFTKPRQKPQQRKPYRARRDYSADSSDSITPEFCMEHGKRYAGAGGGRNNLYNAVIGSFHYWYEKTGRHDLNADSCKRHITQDYEYMTWNDSDKETQIDACIRQYYRG